MPSPFRSLLEPLVAIAEQLKEQNRLSAELVEQAKQQTKYAQDTHWEARRAREVQESIRNTLAAPVLDAMGAFLQERQLGLLDTLAAIRDQRLNLARFGDGEMRQMMRLEHNINFQRNSPELMRALRNVLTVAEQHPDKLLLGLPHGYRDLFWSNIYGDMWRQFQPLIEPIKQFGNSHISRPLMFGAHGWDAVDAWRSLWDGLNVTIVTGEGSRFDLIPELFDNVKSSRFEHSQPINAFADVPRLVEVLEADPSDLVLLALGPAGTVLASELALRGRWAVDAGHMSSSFETEFKNGTMPENTPVVKPA